MPAWGEVFATGIPDLQPRIQNGTGRTLHPNPLNQAFMLKHGLPATLKPAQPSGYTTSHHLTSSPHKRPLHAASHDVPASYQTASCQMPHDIVSSHGASSALTPYAIVLLRCTELLLRGTLLRLLPGMPPVLCRAQCQRVQGAHDADGARPEASLEGRQEPGNLLCGPRSLPILRSHIPHRAVTSYTTKAPQTDAGNWFGLYIIRVSLFCCFFGVLWLSLATSSGWLEVPSANTTADAENPASLFREGCEPPRTPILVLLQATVQKLMCANDGILREPGSER